jgi:hypothetical protein
MNDYDLCRLYNDYAKRAAGAGLGPTRYGVLRALFEKAWCRETASPGCQEKWSATNPAYGQCAVTAVAVQVLCGGTLVRTVVGEFGSHYYNHLINGEGYSVYDLTRDQFTSGTAIQPGSAVDRVYVLESPRAVEARTKERYELLRDRLVAAMRAG